MSKIAIVYWSGTGNTAAMASAIAEGAKEAGVDVTVFTSAEFSADMVSGFNKFAFGCPSMGMEELEETEFEPLFAAVHSSLSGKDVALFGSYGWGDGQWMRDWQTRCEGAGISVVGGAGLIVNETPNDADIEKCKALGKALAG